MAETIGYGTTLTWDGDAVGEITRIGSVELSIAKVDATTLGSANDCKEILPGLIDPGDVEIEGLWKPDDVGQAGIAADILVRASKVFLVTFPPSLGTVTWGGTAYLTKFMSGDATPEGMIPFSATLSIVGKPTLSVA